MGHIQLILDSRKKAKAVTPSARPATPDQVPDLPGLHRRQNLAAINLTDQKREYTLSVRTVQALNKKMNSLKGNRKKDARHQVNELKARMEKLLTKIGTYTPSERVHGFKEEGDAF